MSLWARLASRRCAATNPSPRCPASTTAVVGVILDLAVWSALHALFGELHEIRTLGVRLVVPVWSMLQPFSLLIAVSAMIALIHFKAEMIPALLISALVGMVYYVMAPV
jgi:chromate transporter